MALGLHKDERLGLAGAVVLHAALLGVLFLDPHSDQQVEPPERIEVTISDDHGLTSTSPDPNSEAAADVAPTLGEAAPAPEPAPMPEADPSPAPPEPRPEPVEPARPAPQPKKTPPRPVETRKPEPKKEPVTKKAESKPEPKKAPPKEKAEDRKKSPIDDIVKPKSEAKPKAQPKPKSGGAPKSEGSSSKATSKPAEKSGGSRIGADFLDGVTGAKSTEGKGTPAAAAGPQVRSALSAAITRQLKPHWQAPQGPGAEELVTYLAFRLNQDGSLDGRPTVVRQTGITDVNRNQASRHAEQAIKAVQLAAPFNLPAEHYDAWKRVTSFKFDKRLSQ